MTKSVTKVGKAVNRSPQKRLETKQGGTEVGISDGKDSKVLKSAVRRKPPNAGKGRVKGVPNKATANAREAIARFVDGNADRLQEWLDRIAAEDGPKAAMACFVDLIEYHVPKLGRSEIEVGKPGDFRTKAELDASIIERATKLGIVKAQKKVA